MVCSFYCLPYLAFNFGRFHYPDIGDVAVKFAVVEAVTDHEFIRHLKAAVAYGNMKKLIKTLAEKSGARKISITRGHLGALVYDAEEGFSEVPVFSSNVVDRVGAGDAYLSFTAPLVCSGAPMTKEVIFRFLDDAAEIGVKAVSFVSDGESTCSPHLYDAILRGKANGLDMALGTNGYLLKEDRLEEILPALTYLRFNISAGEPARYREIMGAPEDGFEKVTGLIAKCAEIKKRRNLPVTIGMRLETENTQKDYLHYVKSAVNTKAIAAGLKKTVVVDCMHGSAAGLMPALLATPKIKEIRTKHDPLFGGVQPEPIKANLAALTQAVTQEKALAGIAFDGDGDRI